ncbi:MAG: DNA-3-methyladenine glycosylase [Saprospirales bacterium]|nr:MAG: DNA-3-methyladenine glycosylase [Saprospirales bacterium]
MGLLNENVLDSSFFEENNAIDLAVDLIGCSLHTSIGGEVTSGLIVETEAYCAPEDRASHAWQNRKTPRTEVMFESGGLSYIYLCYGIHHLFNVVCGSEGLPHAVLIRGIEPLEGVSTMLKRRDMSRPETRLTAGPGCLSRALGLTVAHSGKNLHPDYGIWLEKRKHVSDSPEIISTTRIGIDYAGKWKDKPWRFYLKDSKWISKK